MGRHPGRYRSRTHGRRCPRATARESGHAARSSSRKYSGVHRASSRLHPEPTPGSGRRQCNACMSRSGRAAAYPDRAPKRSGFRPERTRIPWTHLSGTCSCRSSRARPAARTCAPAAAPYRHRFSSRRARFRLAARPFFRAPRAWHCGNRAPTHSAICARPLDVADVRACCRASRRRSPSGRQAADSANPGAAPPGDPSYMSSRRPFLDRSNAGSARNLPARSTARSPSARSRTRARSGGWSPSAFLPIFSYADTREWKVMPESFRIGLVQSNCSADPNENLAKAEWKIREAASRGAQIVCLQELFRSQYFCREENAELFALAEPIPGPSTQTLGKLARELEIVIVASLFERRAPGLYHNTAAVLSASGEIAGLYRKMHIPDDPLYFEKFYFTPGDLGFVNFDTSFGRLGVLVCWDQWYPEAARLTSLGGPNILFYPTAIGWHPAEKAQYGA